MNTTIHASRSFVQQREGRYLPSVRIDRILARTTLLLAAAFFAAEALRFGAEAGPRALYLLVFALGGIALVTAATWLMPLLGALLVGAGGVAAWIFLDVTPLNAWMALTALVAMAFSLRCWMVEVKLRPNRTV